MQTEPLAVGRQRMGSELSAEVMVARRQGALILPTCSLAFPDLELGLEIVLVEP